MSVDIEVSASSMPESLSSLEATPLVMHRVWFEIADATQWYLIQREARALYGPASATGWKSQPRVLRRIRNLWDSSKTFTVWFETPDPAFATWISIKLGMAAKTKPNK